VRRRALMIGAVRVREVNKRIEGHGGVFVRQKGSHRVYRVNRGTWVIMVVVPQHSGDVPRGTLRSIERDLEPMLGERWLT
jgi:predicted RNA binding protein YcfA (HicA-like mRNA interferase family)